jgi:hypothetical protein
MAEQTGLTVNNITGEEVIAPLTKNELDFINLVSQQSKEIDDARLAKESARQSALAKLAAIGLTEAEIAAL